MPYNPLSQAVREENPICQYTIFQVEDLQNLRGCILATTNALRKQFNHLKHQLKNSPQRGNCHVWDTKPFQWFTRRSTTTCQSDPLWTFSLPNIHRSGYGPYHMAHHLLSRRKWSGEKASFCRETPRFWRQVSSHRSQNKIFKSFQREIEKSHYEISEWNRHRAVMAPCSIYSLFVQIRNAIFSLPLSVFRYTFPPAVPQTWARWQAKGRLLSALCEHPKQTTALVRYFLPCWQQTWISLLTWQL